MMPWLAGHERPELLEATGSGPGLFISGLEPPKARPFARLSGQAGPEEHYWAGIDFIVKGLNNLS
jgi:hypothetical protein